jgi:hypothetical protein
MDVVRTSEMSYKFKEIARRYIPEGFHKLSDCFRGKAVRDKISNLKANNVW